MHVLFEDSVLKITSRAPEPAPDGRRTLLSFTGVGHGMGGVNVQKAEFFGTGRNFDNLLFLTDKTRSWGNLLDFDDIAARLAPFREGTELSAIGNSMGGFLAIVASRFMPMRRVVSFVPQFSVDPALVPWEFRWKEYREAIREFKIRDAGDYFQPETTYFLFSGGAGIDRRQARLFPVRDNLHHHLFADAKHDLATDLKDAGLLTPLIQSILEGGSDRGLEEFMGRYPGQIEHLSPNPVPA